jgi:4-hydroxyphenylpyruvate dioxygenase
MLLGFAWVELCVHDANHWRDRLVACGFCAVGYRGDRSAERWALRNGGVLLVVSQPAGDGAVAEFLRRTSEGIGDIAFAVVDPDAFAGAHPGEFPGTRQLRSPAGITHTLVPGAPGLPPGFVPLAAAENPRFSGISDPVRSRESPLFSGIDHATLNVRAEDFTEICRWYADAFGLTPQRHFEIGLPGAALTSAALADPAARVRLPINIPRGPNSQIQEFLDAHGGAGVQHVALATPDLCLAVERLAERGLRFLSTPATYYRRLAERVNLSGLDRQRLERLGVLVDRDGHDRLLQIFTAPLFAKPSLFLELIERQGRAVGFGEGNFQALFDAIEAERRRRDPTSAS